MTVEVRLFAAARAAVGAGSLQVAAGPISSVCESVVAASPEPARTRQVLAASTLLCDGVRYRASDSVELADGLVLDVLPPFAGG